ncbi:MAG TPA: DNA primase [Chryseolinea sp.]|nr:DNA primase [Chryseolinea sp.]
MTNLDKLIDTLKEQNQHKTISNKSSISSSLNPIISNATIELVRELPIADVVRHYVELKKSGSSYTARSPFTDEKTPSFFVVPSKNIFKCFSSGKGGDAIRFVMEKENLPYPEAVKDICSKCNIQVEYEKHSALKHAPDNSEQLYSINQDVANHYAVELLSLNDNHPACIELFGRRQYTRDTILQWQIGYAPGNSDSYNPGDWRFLAKSIKNDGHKERLIELGLVTVKNNICYDAYRNRLMFPIIDHRGRYCGFGGRALDPDQFNPKYVNSIESKLFNKSKLLYGLNFAVSAIRKKGFANLVEGYTDVISFHQASLDNTVGTCGTSLTEDQCRLLKKFTSHVKLFYDGDEAGKNATLRAIDILIATGIQTSVVPMPAASGTKVDPDELVRVFSVSKK